MLKVNKWWCCWLKYHFLDPYSYQHCQQIRFREKWTCWKIGTWTLVVQRSEPHKSTFAILQLIQKMSYNHPIRNPHPSSPSQSHSIPIPFYLNVLQASTAIHPSLVHFGSRHISHPPSPQPPTPMGLHLLDFHRFQHLGCLQPTEAADLHGRPGPALRQRTAVAHVAIHWEGSEAVLKSPRGEKGNWVENISGDELDELSWFSRK